MAALPPGKLAPDFSLVDAKGRTHALGEILKSGPVLVAFFKVTCPTCRLAFPYIERLNQAYGDCVPFFGIAQDPIPEALVFARENGKASFTILPDGPDYPVSSLYGITNVPTLFALDRTGKIAFTGVGFSKKDYLELAGILAEGADRLVIDLFPKGDPAPTMKPG